MIEHSAIPRRSRLRQWAPAAFGPVLAAGLVALGLWLAYRPLARGPGSAVPRPAPASVAGPQLLAGPRGIGVAAAARDSAPPAPYAVDLAAANTAAGAILWLRQMGPNAPAGTFAHIPRGATSEYRVLAGAFPDSAEAAALLGSLRSHGQLSETRGTVALVPLAYLIERDVAADAAAARVAAYVARGLPVYALRQANGRVRVFAGAFASAREAELLGATLRQARVRASLVQRTGRTF